LRLEKNLLTVAMADPLLFSLVQDLEFQTGYRIKQVVATRADILDAIAAGYPDKGLMTTATAKGGASSQTPAARGSQMPATSDGQGGASSEAAAAKRPEDDVFEPIAGIKERSEAAPIVDLVDLIMKSAIKSAASDVHIEPMEKGVLVRQRLDGLLKEAMDLPKWVHEGLIARLKIMAGMDIAEKRLPQDGRVRVNGEDGREVDFRASTLRTLHGEKIVLRMLDHRKGVPALGELGLSTASLSLLREMLRHQHGMILVVGPTGSGKTTTLCSALVSIQSERTNIITVEDPIEYQLPGINQTQIQEKIKLTFASALRSILRQDPDVILVGEIRDQETARIALQAAQTGHLVLSTLHTDDAPSSVTRLIDIGVEPFVLSSALLGIVAQRLIRRLCPSCKKQYTPPADVLRALNMSEAEASGITFFKAVGCDYCNGTGFRGRIGIYEVMKVSDKVRRLISTRGSEEQIREAAQEAGMLSLSEDALGKVKAGLTTPEELMRVVTEVKEVRSVCTDCGSPVSSEYQACPNCGKRLSGACPGCNRTLEPHWTFCPYCSRNLQSPVERRLKAKRAPKELPAGNVAEFKKGSLPG
jgi:type IV pilus assembly protein PilB